MSDPAPLELFPETRGGTSLRVEDHIVTATANKDSLEEHGWQQAVFMTALEAFLDAHWSHE